MQPVWLKSYPSNVPSTINPDQYSSLVDMLNQAFDKFGTRPAFSNFGTKMTYAELAVKSRSFAAYLQKELQLVPGDRVAIMMPNALQYPVALYGILQAGCVVVNVNPLYTATELEHILNDCGAKAIIILENFAHVLQQALPQLKMLKYIVVTKLGDSFPLAKRLLVNTVVKYVKRLVKPWQIPGVKMYRDILKSYSEGDFKPIAIDANDIAFLQYTGGTTGVSKGAMLTHRNMIANVLQMAVWLRAAKSSEEKIQYSQEVIVTPLPLYHIFSLTVNCLTFTMTGGQNVLITNPRDIKGFIHEIRRTHFRGMSGVNTLYNALLHHEEFEKIDFSNLSYAVAGGMAAQRAVAEKWQKITKSPIIEGYGLTEASPVVTANPLDIKEYTGSIGLPIPNTEVMICDDDGNEVATKEIGELWARGPQVMKGYWHNDEETAKVLTKEGWLKTGDIAYMDERGYFFLVDRKKDMINVSGFNVYPNEVEDVIAKHPGVLEVAVVGIPDPQSGEKVKAFIVKSDPKLTAEEVINFCHQDLTRYKVPHEIEFRADLPKTNVGKILRRALRES